MNRPITSTEIETVIKKIPTNKSSEPDGCTGKFYQTLRVNIYPSETLPKNCRGRNTPKLILQDHHHSDTKTRQRYHKKRENYRPITLMNIDAKIQQNSSKPNPTI